MKIEQIEPKVKFKSVVIKLETLDEVKDLYNEISGYSTTGSDLIQELQELINKYDTK